jgi:3-deoxy-manno-octulosonate cytidylyltransferase (CMP-KDO synthetase)
MRVLGVIPARLGSTRLPNKPLQPLAGEPLVTRVVERVLEHGLLSDLVVATDSAAVAEVVKRTRGRAVLTGNSHSTGTDRVAEIARRPEFAAFDVILNIQGDEPFISREALSGALGRVVEQGDDIGTAAAPLDPALADDLNRVKVVTDARGRALYFSRAVIPHHRVAGEPNSNGRVYWQHVGVYAYTRRALGHWVSLPPSPPERAEQLEQLRALYYGMTIGVARLETPVFPGIDTADDLRRAEAHWHAYQGQV